MRDPLVQRRMVEIGQTQSSRDRDRIAFVDSGPQREGEDDPRGEKAGKDRERDPVCVVVSERRRLNPVPHRSSRSSGQRLPRGGPRNELIERRPELRPQGVALDQDLMLRAFDHDDAARPQPGSETPRGAGVGDLILAGGDDEGRRQCASCEIRFVETTHSAERRVRPTDRRTAETQLGRCFNQPRDPGEPRRVGREDVVLVWPRPEGVGSVSRGERAPEAQTVQRFYEISGEAVMVDAFRGDHRRGQDETIERAAASFRRDQENGRAHGVTEAKPRTRTARLEDRADKRLEVALVMRKIVDMTFTRVAQRTLRPALAAPIHCGDAKIALEQILRHLEIFFDEFAAPAEHRDGSPRRRFRVPSDRSQANTVGGQDVRFDSARRDRIFERRRQTHAPPAYQERQRHARAPLRISRNLSGRQAKAPPSAAGYLSESAPNRTGLTPWSNTWRRMLAIRVAELNPN